jgi:hypothetical protein
MYMPAVKPWWDWPINYWFQINIELRLTFILPAVLQLKR